MPYHILKAYTAWSLHTPTSFIFLLIISCNCLILFKILFSSFPHRHLFTSAYQSCAVRWSFLAIFGLESQHLNSLGTDLTSNDAPTHGALTLSCLSSRITLGTPYQTGPTDYVSQFEYIIIHLDSKGWWRRSRRGRRCRRKGGRGGTSWNSCHSRAKGVDIPTKRCRDQRGCCSE